MPTPKTKVGADDLSEVLLTVEQVQQDIEGQIGAPIAQLRITPVTSRGHTVTLWTATTNRGLTMMTGKIRVTTTFVEGSLLVMPTVVVDDVDS